MSFSISGKTAIVTGAANGVGLAIARHFVNEGANVMFADMDEARLEAEVESLGTLENQASYFAGDLREKLTLANLLSATLDEFENVDILVNASRQVLRSDPLNPDDDAFQTLMDQNVTAQLRLSQIVAKRMMKQGEENTDPDRELGTIVNLTSIAARLAHPELMSFSISAAALDQMTRSLAVALASHRIRVNGVAIGSVMSASLQNAMKENPDLRDVVTASTPLGYIGEASQVVEAVHYLASGGSGFVTGQILTVDGGRSLIDPVAAAEH